METLLKRSVFWLQIDMTDSDSMDYVSTERV